MNKSDSYIEFLFDWGLYFLAIILILLLLIVLKIFSGLLLPCFLIIKSLLFEENNPGISLFSIIIRIFVLLSSLYLVFLVFSLFTTILSYNLYKSAASKYDYKEFRLEDILFKGLSWNTYRAFYVLFPPFVVLISGIVLFLAFLYFFNIFLAFAGFSLGLTSFITVFITITLILSFIFAVIMAVYNLAVTLFGTECAVSEPDLPNDVIKNRSIRLAFNKPSNFILYSFYFAFIIFVTFQLGVSIAVNNSINSDNMPNILILFCFNMLFLFGLNRLKAQLYIESLVKQYELITVNNNDLENYDLE